MNQKLLNYFLNDIPYIFALALIKRLFNLCVRKFAFYTDILSKAHKH